MLVGGRGLLKFADYHPNSANVRRAKRPKLRPVMSDRLDNHHALTTTLLLSHYGCYVKGDASDTHRPKMGNHVL